MCAQAVAQDSAGTQYLAQISCAPDRPVDKLSQSLKQCGAVPTATPDSNVLSWPTVYSGSEFTLYTAGAANATLISCLKGIEHNDNKPDAGDYVYLAWIFLPLAAAIFVTVVCCCTSACHSCGNALRRQRRRAPALPAPQSTPAEVPAAARPTARRTAPSYRPPSPGVELAAWPQGEPAAPPPAYMSGKASAA